MTHKVPHAKPELGRWCRCHGQHHGDTVALDVDAGMWWTGAGTPKGQIGLQKVGGPVDAGQRRRPMEPRYEKGLRGVDHRPDR